MQKSSSIVTPPESTEKILSYGMVAIGFHWSMALLIAAGFSLGLIMTELPFSPLKLKLFSWHKWLGITILLLVFLRGCWRLIHPLPPLPLGLPRWQIKASQLVHLTLYILMTVVPFSGWLYSSSAGVPTVYFGLLQLPDLIAANKELKPILQDIHGFLAWSLAAIVGLHILAALKHHFIDRDGLLSRMWPGRN